MNTFLSVLATFYMCEAMSAEGPLAHDLQLRCAAAFETLELSFLNDDERRAISEIGLSASASSHAGLIRFQEWEADNAEMVSRFMDAARTVATSMR